MPRMPKRKMSKVYVIKTLRFDPALMDDIEKVIYYTHEGREAVYPTLTSFIVKAVAKLVREERLALEKEGIVWAHLKPKHKA